MKPLAKSCRAPRAVITTTVMMLFFSSPLLAHPYKRWACLCSFIEYSLGVHSNGSYSWRWRRRLSPPLFFQLFVVTFSTILQNYNARGKCAAFVITSSPSVTTAMSSRRKRSRQGAILGADLDDFANVTLKSNSKRRLEQTADTISTSIDEPCILLTIHGHRYNVTSWAKAHPSGAEVLKRHHDHPNATSAFEAVGHSEIARQMLQEFEIFLPADSNEDWDTSTILTLSSSSPQHSSQLPNCADNCGYGSS